MPEHFPKRFLTGAIKFVNSFNNEQSFLGYFFLLSNFWMNAERLKQIEEIYFEKNKIREKRLAVLYPNGTPV